jgi:hypothetical protein
VQVINAGDNLGPAGGLALGVRALLDHASTEEHWLLFLDDDQAPTSTTQVAELVAFAESELARSPEVGGVGLVGVRFARRSGSLVRLTDRELTGTVDVDAIGGGQYPLLRIDVVREVGGPDPQMFFGLEEVEYHLRVRAAGYRLLVDANRWRAARREWDRVGIGRRGGRAEGVATWRSYYSSRNQVIVARRHGGRLAPLAAMSRGVARAMAAAVRGRWSEAHLHARGVRDGALGRLGRRVEPAVSSAARK